MPTKLRRTTKELRAKYSFSKEYSNVYLDGYLMMMVRFICYSIVRVITSYRLYATFIWLTDKEKARGITFGPVK